MNIHAKILAVTVFSVLSIDSTAWAKEDSGIRYNEYAGPNGVQTFSSSNMSLESINKQTPSFSSEQQQLLKNIIQAKNSDAVKLAILKLKKVAKDCDKKIPSGATFSFSKALNYYGPNVVLNVFHYSAQPSGQDLLFHSTINFPEVGNLGLGGAASILAGQENKNWAFSPSSIFNFHASEVKDASEKQLEQRFVDGIKKIAADAAAFCSKAETKKQIQNTRLSPTMESSELDSGTATQNADDVTGHKEK